MKDYRLQEDEVILYKGNVKITERDCESQLLLTNHNVVFINKEEMTENNENVLVEAYKVEDIKIYKDIPQIKAKGLLVEIYFISAEIEFLFKSRSEVHRFINEALKLLTGKSKVERNAEKIKKAIGLVDDTLGIDSVKIVGNAIKSKDVLGKTASLATKSVKGIVSLCKKGNKNKSK